MPTYRQYWILIRLTANGRGQPQELPETKQLIQQLSPQAQAHDEVEGDRTLQRQLCQTANDPAASPEPTAESLEERFQHPATLGLRCYISHQTLQVCHKLVEQFGANYGFELAELLPTVLDDDGRPLSGPYRPLSYKILDRFDPDIASLSTWASRLIRHHDDLTHFLKAQGLLLISDWALLNDTQPSKLRKALLDFHQLSPAEFEAASALLAAYHHTYRQARIRQGRKGRCEAPTPEQCQAIAAQMPTTAAMRPQEVFKALLSLAKQMRIYNVARKKGIPQGLSLDVPEAINLADPSAQTGAEETAWIDLLETYRTQLNACLTQAVKDVIEQRLQSLMPKQPKTSKPSKTAQQPKTSTPANPPKPSQQSDKRQSYLTALQLFYCEGYSMSQLAPQIGLKKQYQVTRLLNLKPFCADIRHQAIAHLQAHLREPFSQLMPPERLAELDQILEEHVGQDLDRLIQTETNRTQTPGQHRKDSSQLAQVICQVLQQNTF